MESDKSGIYINPSGKELQVSIKVLMPVDRKATSEPTAEGITNFVEARFHDGQTEKTSRMVEKTITGRKAWGMGDVEPMIVVEKWKELVQFGVNTIPELMMSKDNKRLLMTDLSNGGKLDVWDGGIMILGIGVFKDHVESELNMGSLSWFKKMRYEIFEQLINNSEKASKAGFLIYPDSWFFVHDPQTGDVEVVLGDLGQGVVKHQTLSEAESVKLKSLNIDNVKRFAEQFRLFSKEEWNSRYSDYKYK